MITLERLNETRAKLKALKPNASEEVTIKMAIDKLRPEIARKIKAGLSYKEIGAAIFDGLGLDESQGKRENFWRSVLRYYKSSKKGITKTRRKSARTVAEDAHSQSQDVSQD